MRYAASLLLSLVCSSAWASDWALLVGVSGYPALSAEFRLAGPANDVRLLRGVLQKKSMPAEQIVTLADGVEGSAGLPTRARILAQLQSLAKRARSGDWVLLYFSGHGSQQPRLLNDGNEPDSLDEIFLPYDVGRWNGKIGKVDGAIPDDEIALAISAIQRGGAQVWVVFDTCHAGDMIKSQQVGRQVWLRGLPPQVLGVPDKTLSKAWGNDDASRRPPEGVVAFYASRSDEPAAEELFAEKGQAPKRQGVFTWYLTQELARGPKDLGALAKAIQQRYRMEKRPFPNPQFLGGLEKSPSFIR